MSLTNRSIVRDAADALSEAMMIMSETHEQYDVLDDSDKEALEAIRVIWLQLYDKYPKPNLSTSHSWKANRKTVNASLFE